MNDLSTVLIVAGSHSHKNSFSRRGDIITYTVKDNVDLIVIASHGRLGVSRWVLESVADRIVR